MISKFFNITWKRINKKSKTDAAVRTQCITALGRFAMNRSDEIDESMEEQLRIGFDMGILYKVEEESTHLHARVRRRAFFIHKAFADFCMAAEMCTQNGMEMDNDTMETTELGKLDYTLNFGELFCF